MSSTNNVTWLQDGTVTLSPFGGTNMRTSTSIAKIASALSKAQRNIGAASKGSDNPFFRSKYADLGSVMEACKGALNEQGITVLQPVVSEGANDYVETMLLHESGEYMASRMRLIVSKPNMQELGSSISYARRYGLQSMVFIPAADDDGELAVGRSNAQRSQKVSAPEVTTTSATPNTAVTTQTTLPQGSVQATVEPLKKSSFRKPKKVETPTETTESANDDWS